MRIAIFVILSSMALSVYAQDHENLEQVGRIFEFWEYGYDVAVQNKYAYVATGLSGLQIVDVSDPAHPELTGYWDNNPGKSMRVTVAGDYAYLADWNFGFVVVNIEDPSHPFEAGRFEEPIAIRDMHVADGYLYIADASTDNDGFRIVDVRDPENPEQVGFNDGTDWAYSLAIAGDYAYITDYHYQQNFLLVLDISDPYQPETVRTIDLEGREREIVISGNIAYLTVQNADSCDYYILDISQPDSPEVVNARILESVINLRVNGDYMYMLGGRSALYTLDISNPADPRELGNCVTRSSARMACTDDFVYIASGNEHLRFVDVSDPDNPQPAGDLVKEGFIESLGLFSDVAWASGEGLYMLDISDPQGLEEIDYIRNITYNDIVIDGDIACAKTRSNTFEIIDCSDPTFLRTLDQLTFQIDDG